MLLLLPLLVCIGIVMSLTAAYATREARRLKAE
jgi:hypothetical protein